MNKILNDKYKLSIIKVAYAKLPVVIFIIFVAISKYFDNKNNGIAFVVILILYFIISIWLDMRCFSIKFITPVNQKLDDWIIITTFKMSIIGNGISFSLSYAVFEFVHMITHSAKIYNLHILIIMIVLMLLLVLSLFKLTIPESIVKHNDINQN